MLATRARLSHQRWHFQHGPIDLVLAAFGDAVSVAGAHERAWQRFQTVLPELVSELPLLRCPVGPHNPLQGVVAQRMWRACFAFRHSFITPMAAVAGAVAQEIAACYDAPGVARAWVNNGGDIALVLQPGQSVRVGCVADLARFQADHGRTDPALDGQFTIASTLPVRGVATSGWRGRSFSLGIADSVTVLAASAAQADAAATVIANAVNLDDPRIRRTPACWLKDDTDLGALAVTVAVPPLPAALVQQALAAGWQTAQALRAAALIDFALLICQGQARHTPVSWDAQNAAVGSAAVPGLVFA